MKVNEGINWHSNENPYANKYGSKDNGDNSPDYSRCWGKIMWLLEQTGVQLDVQSISWLCSEWGTKDAAEWYAYAKSLTKEELKEWANKAKKHKRMLTDAQLQFELSRTYV